MVVRDELRGTLGFDELHILNDLKAIAWAVPSLQPDQRSALYGHIREPPAGPITVLGVRIGREEFVCLIAGANAAEARRFAERLRLDLATGKRPVTFSGGLVQGRAGEDLNALMTRGDQATYRAKENGRNRVVAAVWARKHSAQKQNSASHRKV